MGVYIKRVYFYNKIMYKLNNENKLNEHCLEEMFYCH